jgi:hypothetical protein
LTKEWSAAGIENLLTMINQNAEVRIRRRDHTAASSALSARGKMRLASNRRAIRQQRTTAGGRRRVIVTGANVEHAEFGIGEVIGVLGDTATDEFLW